ncbi:MAG TPA: protease complex subunit PrcB family protein [Symbiobacteriaceae bacterium]|nr:protease complex subunit PrcB family protein [Symbiobacteriaceae bacterium]
MKLMLVADPAVLPGLSGQFARPAVALPEVDWSREAVLVIDMGEQRTAGYGVSVVAVTRSAAGEVELQLEIRRPGPGSFVAQVITHPYTVVRVDREWLTGATVVARDQHGQEVLRQVVSL